MLGRDAVNALGEDSHEIGSAAGDDAGFESVGAEKFQHLEHGLVGELVVGAVEARVLGRGEPDADAVGKVFGGHARAGEVDDVEDAFVVVGEERGEVAGEGGLHHRIVFPCGFVGQAAFQFVEREGELEGHGVLRPERAVVVEHGEALRSWNELLGVGVGDFGDKVEDGLLGRAGVPGGKRIGSGEGRQ